MTPPATETKGGRGAKIAVVLTVIVALVVAQRTGLLDEFKEPARVKHALVELGGWGYLAFIMAYASLQPFGIPGTVFVLAAALIWRWPVAFALSMVGTMAASVVGFSFARFVARDWVETKIPARFRKYDEALARRAFATVFVLRLVLWMPPLLHAFFGVSKVRFATHFWASFVGYLLPLFLMSFFGQKLFDTLTAKPAWAWIAPAIVLTAIGIWVLIRRRSRALSPGTQVATGPARNQRRTP